ncbi:MAG: hypothetical protein ACK5F7_00155, partial [Planctomycetaceae bacterium]
MPETLQTRVLLAAVAWDGGGDGVSWTDRLNWSTDLIPGSSDDVVVDLGTATIRHDSGTNSVKSLTLKNPFQLRGGTLTIGETASLQNDFVLDGGKLSGGVVTLDTGKT